MSCRRSDKNNLIGCRIGEVALRGCSRGCCPYPDSDISLNTRPHLLDGYEGPNIEDPSNPPPGRTGLYYPACQSSYRPKFICPRKTCQRSIKPVFDPDKHEYDISLYQDWRIRPARDSKQMKLAYANQNRLGSKGYKEGNHGAERDRIVELRDRYDKDDASLAQEELLVLRENDPGAWWMDIFTIIRGMDGIKQRNMKRCPSCGKEALRVGSNFRIPARKDEKGWDLVERMIDGGVDMVGKFSACATFKEHEKMTERARELRALRENSFA